MMLQSYDIQDSEISCDTTSILTTPFSVKDILNMNINNENEYCCNSSVKKETFTLQPQFWENTVFTTNDYNYFCNSGSERHYWNSDNVHSESYSQQYGQNFSQNDLSGRLPVKEDGYDQSDSSSKLVYSA